jgi:hypothetical protein
MIESLYRGLVRGKSRFFLLPWSKQTSQNPMMEPSTPRLDMAPERCPVSGGRAWS